MGIESVGLVANGFWPQVGGIQRQVYDVSSGLADLGLTVKAVAVRGPVSLSPADASLSLKGGRVSVRWSRVPQVGDRNEGQGFPVDLYTRFSDEWASFLDGCQIVCAFGYSPVLCGAEVSRIIGVPLVAVVPGVPVELDERTRLVFGQEATYVTVSEFMRQRAQTVHGIEMRLIYNAVDTEFFRPCAGRRDPAPTILVPSRLDPDKDIELAFRSLWHLRKKDFEGVRLVVTGNGSVASELGLIETYLDELLELVDRLGLRNCVEFARGKIAADKMPATYSRASVSMLTSRTEGFGLGLAESLACGTPVVATATEGINEIFHHGLHGYAVPTRDPEEISRYLAQVLSDSELHRRMGMEGRRWIQDRFPVSRQAHGYRDLFAEVLEGA